MTLLVKTENTEYCFTTENGKTFYSMNGIAEFLVTRQDPLIYGQRWAFYGRKLNPYTGQLGSETFFYTTKIRGVEEIN